MKKQTNKKTADVVARIVHARLVQFRPRLIITGVAILVIEEIKVAIPATTMVFHSDIYSGPTSPKKNEGNRIKGKTGGRVKQKLSSPIFITARQKYVSLFLAFNSVRTGKNTGHSCWDKKIIID